MDLNKLVNALKIIRRELIIKDEPLKAYRLLEYFNLPELKDELGKTYGMIRHVFSEKEYHEAYDIPVNDAETIEGEDAALDASIRYARYDWILNEVKRENAQSILDLGCYVGSVVLTAARRGVKAVGVDMTQQSIDIARKRAKKFGITNATFYVEDVTKFNKERADLVVSMEVLEHVVNPVAYLAHMASLANKWAYVSTPDGPYGNGEGNLTMPGGWEWDGKGVRGHIRVFNKTTLKDALEKANCEIALLEGRDDQLLHAKFRRKDGF